MIALYFRSIGCPNHQHVRPGCHDLFSANRFNLAAMRFPGGLLAILHGLFEATAIEAIDSAKLSQWLENGWFIYFIYLYKRF